MITVSCRHKSVNKTYWCRVFGILSSHHRTFAIRHGSHEVGFPFRRSIVKYIVPFWRRFLLEGMTVAERIKAKEYGVVGLLMNPRDVYMMTDDCSYAGRSFHSELAE